MVKEVARNLPVSDIFFRTATGQEVRGERIHSRKPNEIPIVYGLGWGVKPAVHQAPREKLAANRDVWCIETSDGKAEKRLPLSDPLLNHIPEIEIQKAMSLLELLKHMKTTQGISQVDVVAYSEGAIHYSIAAYLAQKAPDAAHVRSLVLVNPAGLIERDSHFGLMSRFLVSVIGNGMRHPQFYLQHRRDIRLSKPQTVFHEANAIAKTNLVPILDKLQETKIGVIVGDCDRVFPLRRMQQRLKDTLPFSVIHTRHDGIYIKSEETIAAVEQMLKDLNGSHNTLD